MRIDVIKRYDRLENVQIFFGEINYAWLYFGKRLVTFTLILVIFRKFKKFCQMSRQNASVLVLLK